MTPRIALMLLGASLLVWFTPAKADPVAVSTLSVQDANIYRDIFQAQASGHIAKAETLTAKLNDSVLLGHVLLQRYLAHGYTAKFADLKSWLDKYSDLPGADLVYRLAKKRAPKRAHLTTPTPVKWRGGGYDEEPSDTSLKSSFAQQTEATFRRLERNSKPEEAHAMFRGLQASEKLPQSDIDQLGAYVAAAYLAEGRDDEAYALADQIAETGRGNAPSCDWVAGLSAYRLGKFEDAAHHFELLAQSTNAGGSKFAAAAFWAARAWMHGGHPERVVTLYDRAATQRTTFYGALAARALGREVGFALNEPALDAPSFAALMQNPAARRAVALWQVGRSDGQEEEMLHAFGEIDPVLDPAFAAVANRMGLPALELKAAETSVKQNVYLTGLYPVPPYEPSGGYRLNESIVLAIARIESRFDPEAESQSGARGLMQVMPATAAEIAGDRTLKGKNRAKLSNPAYNMELGQRYLLTLLDDQNGNLIGLTAAYNAGPGNLMRWMESHEDMKDPLLFIESIPANETRDYVKRVLMNLWMYDKRLGKTPAGLDQAAAGAWPVYKEASGTLAPLPLPY